MRRWHGHHRFRSLGSSDHYNLFAAPEVKLRNCRRGNMQIVSEEESQIGEIIAEIKFLVCWAAGAGCRWSCSCICSPSCTAAPPPPPDPSCSSASSTAWSRRCFGLVKVLLSAECFALALQRRRYSGEQTEPADLVFSLNAAVNVLSSDTDVTFCPCWHFQQFLLVGIFQPLANLINFLARLITEAGECHCRGRVCVRLVWRSEQFWLRPPGPRLSSLALALSSVASSRQFLAILACDLRSYYQAYK